MILFSDGKKPQKESKTSNFIVKTKNPKKIILFD
jgi:hypothetical protein